MPRRSLKRARTILTGASSGIGWALAEQLADQQARLLLTARRGERLDALAGQLTCAAPLRVVGDLTDAMLRQTLIETAQQTWGAIDLLINNAGVGAIGRFDEADPQRLRTIMDVNFMSAAELIRAALPLLRQGRQPMIVNVGSVLGHRAVPLKSEYCAAKFALHGFSDALRAELATDGISVLHVCPSTTRSEFFDRLVEDRRDAGKSSPPRGMSSQQVARQIVRAIERDRQEIIISLGGKLLVWLDRLCPPLANRLVR